MKRVSVFLPLLLICLLGVAPAFAQSKPETIYPFKVGEELSYEGELSKLLLRGVNVVDLRFAVRQGPAAMPDAAVAQPSFQFVADAESKGALLKIFRQSFRQHIESTADAATMAALATKKNKDIKYLEPDINSRVLACAKHLNTTSTFDESP